MWLFFVASALLGALGSEVMPSGPAQHLQTLNCPSCERIHCSPRQAQHLRCRGGITTGVCGCCPACARTAGEACGGTWDYLGKCDEGLVCVYEAMAAGKQDAERKGICKAETESLDEESCHPECTKEYCQANPTQICSARLASLHKEACRGSCQHTSCSSCLLLKLPSCPQTCAPSDSPCVHRFGRCVHSRLSAPHRPVCLKNLQNPPEGRLVCLVPPCPNTPK